MKTTIIRSKAEQAKNSGTINITGMTQGEMLALLNALAMRSVASDVCMDVYNSVCPEVKAVWPDVADASITRDEAASIARAISLAMQAS